jgi:hypothetical protein
MEVAAGANHVMIYIYSTEAKFQSANPAFSRDKLPQVLLRVRNPKKCVLRSSGRVSLARLIFEKCLFRLQYRS